MNKKTRILALLLLVCTLMTVMPLSALTVFANGDSEFLDKEDAMDEINASTALSDYKQGETQSFDDDGYIGIPYDVTVYFDSTSGRTAKPGYICDGGTPVIMYVVNVNVERIGTDSDVSIIMSMIERGYAVVVFSYRNNAKAKSPALDWSAHSLRLKMSNGDYFTDKDVFPAGTYNEHIMVPAGYNVIYNDVFFELDRHGVNGTLEKIVNVWNNDFRKYHKDVIVKWVDETASRKATQNGFDGSSPVWYSDADGKTVDAENGIYTKVQYTKAIDVTDCVRPDGRPIDLNLYIHTVYPTNPEKEVAVMTMFSSSGYLVNGYSAGGRPQFTGFLFNGYAGVAFDYAWIPMGKNDHYGYFDGSSGSSSVTGDNQAYATYTFNASQVATAAMRYIRNLSLTDHDTYKFDNDAIGVFGISKAAWMTQLGAPSLREGLLTSENGLTKSEIEELLDDKINSLYSQLIHNGHHGETRYDVGDTETYVQNGVRIDGGELQPYLTYTDGNGIVREISSGAQAIYSSCGAVPDLFQKGYSPQFITVNINDQYNTQYGQQNKLVNLCRIHDIPSLWFETEIYHDFANGNDFIYGVDIYEAMFDFFGYYLKGDAVRVAYTSPMNLGADVAVGTPFTIKFIGEVSSDEIEKIVVTDGQGNPVSGTWTSAYGNTEWSFLADAMKGGTTYTLSIPADMMGSNGKTIGNAQTFAFTTVPEIETSFNAPVSAVTASNNNGAFFSFTVPEAVAGYGQLKLRVKVENKASNKLMLYAASSETDTAGELLGKVTVSGAGYYEYDVSDYVLTKNAGETVYFRVVTETEAGTPTTYEEDFNEGRGQFSTKNYVAYESTTFDGEGVLKVTVKTNEGKFGGEHYFYEGRDVLQNNKVINGGSKVTADDYGRKFTFTVRLYDTVSRPIRLYLNGLTNKTNKVFDYDMAYYTLRTVEGWNEFTIEYTVYEADYALEQQKSFYLYAYSTGDTEMPLYVDNFTVKEVFTDADISYASLNLTKEAIGDYKAPEANTPFEVNGTAYESWADAVNALANGGVLKLTSNYVFTDSDLVNITAKNSFTIDLNGYRLVANNTKNSPLWLGAQNNNAVTVTVKNGSVMLGATPFISFGGSNSSGSGKSYDITLENVYIGLNPKTVLKTIIADGSIEDGVFAEANITLADCVIDVRRERLYDGTVTLFNVGNDDIKINYTLAGGSIRVNGFHELTLCNSAIGATAGADGESTRIIVPEGMTEAPKLSFKTDDGYAIPALEKTENGYRVYSVEPATYSTEYGAIPDKYADANEYPFVIFCDGAFVATADSFGVATNTVTDVLTLNPGRTVSVLMRRNTLHDVGSKKLAILNGTIILDLGGYVMERTSTVFEFATPADYTGDFDTTIIVRNGAMLANGGHIVAFENKASVDKQMYIDFENVTFAAADENSATEYLITRCWATTGTGKNKVEMTLDGCIFDLAGKTEGAQDVSNLTKSLKIFRIDNMGVDANITVYGGEIWAGEGSLSNVTFYQTDSADSIFFEKDEKGNYVTLSVPNGVTPSLSLPTADGKFGFNTLVADGNETDVYTLTNNTVKTEYGTIPAENSGNVFALFMDGAFVGAADTWAEANKLARTTLDANSGKTVTILMRANATSDSISTSDRICFMNGTVIVDLGGKTLTSNKTVFEGGVPSSYAGDYVSTYKVINGTILGGAGIIFATEARSNTAKKMDVIFEDVTFGIDAATFSTSRNKMFLSYGDSASYTGLVDLSLTFNDCEMELNGLTVNYTVFAFQGTPDDVAVDIKLNGGKLVSDCLDKITLYKYDSENDALVFGKGSDGKYTTLSAPAETEIPVIGGVNNEGKGVIFGNGVVNGDNTDYTLVESTLGTKWGVISVDYEDVDAFPFAIFIDGTFRTAKDTWANAFNTVRSNLASNNGKTVYMLMRKDVTGTSGIQHLGRVMGNIVVDLGGYTMTRDSNSLIEVATDGMNAGEDTVTANLTMMNGTMVANGRILTYQVYNDYNKTMNVTFEEITFKLGKTGVNPIVGISYGAKNSGTGVITSELTFKNCAFDFKDIAPTSDAYLLNISSGASSHKVNVVFDGGSIVGDVSKVKLTNLGSNDTVKFVNSGNGYTKYLLTKGSPVSGAVNTDKDTMYFVKDGTQTVDDVKYTVYNLGVNLDGYGIVPYVYYFDTETYPFVLFQNGGFIGARTDWNKASDLGCAYLDNDGDADKIVTVLLRRNYTDNSGGTQFSRVRGKLIIDLGGYTLKANKTFIEAEARHIHDTTIEIVNGTLVNNRASGTGSLIAFNRDNRASMGDGTYNGTAHKNFYITFSGVTFQLGQSGTTITNFITVSWNDPNKSAEETVGAYLTFESCVFDLKTVAPAASSFNVFNGNEAGYIDLMVTVNGGKILADDMANIKFLKSDGEDKLTFAKDENGKYITLTTNGSLPTDKFDTVENYKAVFGNVGETCTLVPAEMKIIGAFLNIQENINVGYTVVLPAGYENPYMVFEFNGKTYKVTKYTTNADGSLVFKFVGVTPQMLGDNIKATLYATNGNEVVSYEKAEYSVKTYCVNMLAKTDDAKLITLLSDLLVYGAASQTYTEDTDELVTKDVEGLTPSTFTEVTKTDMALVGTKNDSVTWKSAALRYENAMAMKFNFKADANLVLKITINGRTTTYNVSELKANEDTGYYTVYFRGILATEYGDVVTASFYNGDTQVGQSVTYSVNSYVKSKQSDSNTALAELVKATYNYGASAEAYVRQ